MSACLSLNTEALEMFAQKRAEKIIQWLLEAAEAERFQQTFAEELLSAVMTLALKELHRTEGSTSAESIMDTALLTSNDLGLYRSGLPAMGSLDYPDAPPTTPLLPELQRNRRSFARQLKGGLAKVFLPSPPPPTPKEREEVDAINPQVELMDLIHSLSTADLTGDCFEAGAKMEAFAEALSSDIVEQVFTEKTEEEEEEEDNHLHLLAQRLAQTIIISSIHTADI